MFIIADYNDFFICIGCDYTILNKPRFLGILAAIDLIIATKMVNYFIVINLTWIVRNKFARDSILRFAYFHIITMYKLLSLLRSLEFSFQ